MSNSSREDSPDWLRSFQTPALTLSSDSAPSPKASPSSDDTVHSQSSKEGNDLVGPSTAVASSNKTSKPKGGAKKKKRKGDGDDGQDVEDGTFAKHTKESHASNHSVWALSSDSESCPDNSPPRNSRKNKIEESGNDEEPVLLRSREVSPVKEASKSKSPKISKGEGHTPKNGKIENDNLQSKGNHGDAEVTEEDTSEKHINAHVSTSRLPLVLSEKVQRSKALVECEGESIDLSGDMGAVGRVVIPDTPSGNSEMYLDLKGTIYRTTIVPSRTFCVVSFGQSEAKIEAIMNDFIQLKTQSNVYEAETMVEGTLEGFSFDSEDETDKITKATALQTDQNEGVEELANGKTKRKPEKSSGVARKKGKSAVGKLQPVKKVRKKTQASKKTKTKK
ncbi:DNA-BINDING PROTEIN BIN4 [Salix viminalis]|uniref:DNA-BINDING PROTEIN BIN4 n=1 Tax=Salix viminalis TaxID=40686 RepID=A0A9Q0NNL6_SALVM|nr:DNA-BINDING PROTEIN BIN4 [Salix viminalis]